ncbi:MAG: hypothetical protein KF814_17035 [Nitrospiraceae bacterium]|nr:hypothetical protein [Nitrospiraceae bacterium]
MAKKAVRESDETRLKKKLSGKKKDDGNGNAVLRRLRKRLKRTQRKRRALALRKKHAGGSQSDGKAEGVAS